MHAGRCRRHDRLGRQEPGRRYLSSHHRNDERQSSRGFEPIGLLLRGIGTRRCIAWAFIFVVGCLLPAGLRRGRERRKIPRRPLSRQTGKYLLTSRLTGFDPTKRTSDEDIIHGAAPWAEAVAEVALELVILRAHVAVRSVARMGPESAGHPHVDAQPTSSSGAPPCIMARTRPWGLSAPWKARSR